MPAPQSMDILARFMADSFDEQQILNEPLAFQAVFGRKETNSFTVISPNANIPFHLRADTFSIDLPVDRAVLEVCQPQEAITAALAERIGG